VLQKKVHMPEMRPMYCDRYGPIEKPYVRGLWRSKRIAEIWGFKVSIFRYLVIIFSCVIFWMTNFEIHTVGRRYQEKYLKFFTEFCHSYLRSLNAILTLLKLYSTQF